MLYLWYDQWKLKINVSKLVFFVCFRYIKFNYAVNGIVKLLSDDVTVLGVTISTTDCTVHMVNIVKEAKFKIHRVVCLSPYHSKTFYFHVCITYVHPAMFSKNLRNVFCTILKRCGPSTYGYKVCVSQVLIL